MAQQDLGLARRLFDGHADGLLAPDRAAMAAQLGHLEFNDRVENETTRILQASPLRLGGEQHGKTATEPSPPDLAARLAKVAEIQDTDLRQRVSANVTRATHQEKQTYLANQRRLKGQAKDIIDRGGAFTDIPYQMLIGIDPNGKIALDAYAQAGGKVSTNFVTYYDLKNLALDNPNGFLDVDLYDHLGEIDQQNLDLLQKLQDGIRNGSANAQINLEHGYKANNDQILSQAGLSVGTSGTPAQRQQVAAFRQKADAQIDAFSYVHGRKPTLSEQRDLVARMAVDMLVARGKPPTSAAPAEIPTSDRTDIISAYKARGIGNPTEEQIQQAYLRAAEVRR